MKATVLLQARVSSSRLPGKVLLPVGGRPLVVLAALRARNTGRKVVVVTSHEPSDDVLCDVLDCSGIPYFRGDLQNTLKRFVDALEGERDDHVVVRLTGDNVLPDGQFIDELLQDFVKKNVAYLCCSADSSGLPYGVSAEVTRAGFLREAHKQTESAFDREHVTPWIIARYGRSSFERYRTQGMMQYRCTVDTLDDYLLVSRLFHKNDESEQLTLEVLLERLKSVSENVVTPKPASRMVLGTAQFGLDYGIANEVGRPEQAQVSRLIKTAISNGVQYLDTARAYGESEKVLGCALSGGWSSRTKIVTKLSPLSDLPAESGPEVAQVFAERSVYQSCHALGVSSIDVLMLHRASHLKSHQGSVWKALLQLKDQGVIGQLGVSVQSPEEALMALEFDEVSYIQLPFNILDHRWNEVIDRISLIRQHRGLIVHARSALLQGLLTTREKALWQRARCTNAPLVIDWLATQAENKDCADVSELCLRFVFSQQWIDGIVVGVETAEQLQKNLVIAGRERWQDNELRALVEERPEVSPQTLDPATWM